MADLEFSNQGSVIGVTALSDEGLDFLIDHVDDSARMGIPIWGDHRPMRDLLEACQVDHGMEVELS